MNIDNLENLRRDLQMSTSVALILSPEQPEAAFLVMDPVRLEDRDHLSAFMRGAPRVLRARSERAFELRAKRPATLAMGIARGRGRSDYFLGARVQGEGRAAQELAAYVESRAPGECDVRIVPHVAAVHTPAWYRRRRRPLEAGLSIGLVPKPGADADAGTLGFIVYDDDAYYALSNNHVLANVNRAEPGDAVIQPGSLDAAPSPKTLVGALDRYVPISFTRRNLVDAAVAEFFEDLDFYEGWIEALPGHVRGTRTVTRDDLDRPVAKVGRTTGETRGKITLVDLETVDVKMTPRRYASFRDQIEIMGDDGTRFCKDGDSGSLIVDTTARAVGLLFASGLDENDVLLTFANPIAAVLAKLGVKLAI